MALWQDRMLAAWPRSLLQDHMLATWPQSLLQDRLLAAWPQSLLPHLSPTPEKLLSVPPVNKYPKHLVEPVLVLQQGKYFYDMFLAFTFKVKTSRAPPTLCCVVIVFVNHVVNHVINLYWVLLIWSLHVHLGATTGAVIWVIIWYKEKWIKICISWSLQVKQQDIFLPWCASFWASLLHDVPVWVPPRLAPLWWDVLAPVNGRLNVNGIHRNLGWAVWMAVLECRPEITERSF